MLTLLVIRNGSIEIEVVCSKMRKFHAKFCEHLSINSRLTRRHVQGMVVS